MISGHILRDLADISIDVCEVSKQLCDYAFSLVLDMDALVDNIDIIDGALNHFPEGRFKLF